MQAINKLKLVLSFVKRMCAPARTRYSPPDKSVQERVWIQEVNASVTSRRPARAATVATAM